MTSAAMPQLAAIGAQAAKNSLADNMLIWAVGVIPIQDSANAYQILDFIGDAVQLINSCHFPSRHTTFSLFCLLCHTFYFFLFFLILSFLVPFLLFIVSMSVSN